MTCKKAQGFLGQESVTVAATVDATKVRYGEADALALLNDIDTLIAAKGKKIETFDLKSARPDDATLLLSQSDGKTRNPRVGEIPVDLRAPPAGTAEVYIHEMPGGQYTNLREQAESMGLGARWQEIARTYAELNFAFGDIVKVTP